MRILRINPSLGLLVAAATAACGGDEPAPAPETGVDVSGDAAADPDASVDVDASDATVEDPSVDEGDALVDPEVDGDPDAPMDANPDVEIDTGPIVLPDPSHVTDLIPLDAAPSPDSLFQLETTTHFRTDAQLPSSSASALAELNGTVYAGSGSGLVRFNGEGFSLVEAIAEPITDLESTGDGLVGVAGDRVFTWTEALGMTWFDNAPFPTAAQSANGIVFVGTTAGLYFDGSITPANGTELWDVRDIVTDGASVWVATQEGLILMGRDALETIVAGDVVDAAVCGQRIVAALADRIVEVAPDGTQITTIAEVGGLPTDRLTSVDCSGDWILVGHEVGGSAISRDYSHTDHYYTERWIISDDVADVLIPR